MCWWRRAATPVVLWVPRTVHAVLVTTASFPGSVPKMDLSRYRTTAVRVGVRAMFAPVGQKGLQRVGSGYGGWYVPPLSSIDRAWTCCTVGVGEDATFDVALAEHGCRVLALDPTPRAVAYIEPLVSAHPTLEFAPYAVWSQETPLEFFPPANPQHVSFSATNLQQTTEPIIVRARPLAAILREFDITSVQLLKLDIEGAEYHVLPTLDLRQLGVEVLCVEFHFEQKRFVDIVRAVRSVERQGLAAARMDHTNVTFLRRSATT